MRLRMYSCPKCGGTMEEQVEKEWHCMMCGYVSYDGLKPVAPLKPGELEAGEKRGRADRRRGR